VILITTSKEPTQRVNSLVRDLSHSIPNAKILRRGKRSTRELPKYLVAEECDRLTIIHRWHGGPGRIEFYKLIEGKLAAHYPIIMLRGTRLRREYNRKGRSEVRGITCGDGDYASALAASLSDFLQIPREDSNPGVSLHISKSEDGHLRIAVTDLSSLEEIGPSMVVDRLVWQEKEVKS